MRLCPNACAWDEILGNASDEERRQSGPSTSTPPTPERHPAIKCSHIPSQIDGTQPVQIIMYRLEVLLLLLHLLLPVLLLLLRGHVGSRKRCHRKGRAEVEGQRVAGDGDDLTLGVLQFCPRSPGTRTSRSCRGSSMPSLLKVAVCRSGIAVRSMSTQQATPLSSGLRQPGPTF